MRAKPDSQLVRLDPGADFPPLAQAWGTGSGAPGLLAAGGVLDVATLLKAYSHGIFPWYSQGQPILWWSPDPRMVLQLANFRLHDSLRKTLRRFTRNPACEIRVDSSFADVIAACAAARPGAGGGTWILPDMQRAYVALHDAGFAHSVETWIDGQLVGGLYCVAIGQAVFGESMFSHRSDASKLALAALACICRRHGIAQIDCQQNTRHLASLGATEMARSEFLAHVQSALGKPPASWVFEPLYWNLLLPPRPVPQ